MGNMGSMDRLRDGKAIWYHPPPYDHTSSKIPWPSKHNSTHDPSPPLPIHPPTHPPDSMAPPPVNLHPSLMHSSQLLTLHMFPVIDVIMVRPPLQQQCCSSCSTCLQILIGTKIYCCHKRVARGMEREKNTRGSSRLTKTSQRKKK